jgi:hypothetical protein
MLSIALNKALVPTDTQIRLHQMVSSLRQITVHTVIWWNSLLNHSTMAGWYTLCYQFYIINI